MAVHLTNGGGLQGHLALVVTPKCYVLIAGAANPIIPPVALPPKPTIIVNATGAQIFAAVCQHNKQVYLFQRFHDTSKAIVHSIIAATPKIHIEALLDTKLGHSK
jgi:hypothetical protein